MIKKHKFDETKKILELVLENSEVRVDLNTGHTTSNIEGKLSEINWPGEYESQGLQVVSVQSAEDEDKLINCIIEGRKILILPSSEKISDLLNEQIVETLPQIDLLIMENTTKNDEEKKITQLVEPRSVVKIGGSAKGSEIQIESINSTNVNFPEETTNVYVV